MEYRRLGKSDLEVSVFGLGGNTFGPPRLDLDASVRNIHRALDLGVNFIDTAIIYGNGESERFVGEALRGRRQEAIVATKFHFRGMAEDETPAQRIAKHCEQSLSKLQTDYIDLFQVHFPEPKIRPEDILEPLAKLVDEGKVRHIGACNYASWRMAEAVLTARHLGLPEFVAAQNHYNLVRRHAEMEMLPFCEAYGVSFVPYFPLGGGVLTGKYRPGEPPPAGSRGAEGSPIVTRTRTPRNEAIAEELRAYAEARSHTLLELAIGWLLAHDVIGTVITGTSTPEQVEANVKATEWKLSPEEKADIDRIAAWDGTGEGAEGGGVGQAPGSSRTQ